MFLKNYKKNLISMVIIVIFSSTAYGEYIGGYLQNWYHYEQGMRQVQAKNYEQAEKEFDYYLTKTAMHGDMIGVAHFGKGLMYQSMGKYDLAITEYKMAIDNDLHPEVKTSEKAYTNIGAIYMKMKNYEEAVHVYTRFVEGFPKNGLAHYYLGLAYLRTKEYEKAEKEAEEAKKLGVPFTALSEELAEIKKSPPKNAEDDNNQTENKAKIGKKNKTAK